MQEKVKVKTSKQIAMETSVLSIVINSALSGMKFVAGILAHSQSMISDAVHSASDIFSTIIVMIGIQISEKKADEEHPYGHERLECVAALLLAVVLAITGGMIGYKGLNSLITGDYKNLQAPGVLALVAAIISIAVKEAMYQYTMFAAKKTNSAALKADAWHHRSDALSSIGALVGILFARFGFPAADPIASIVICIFILKAAWDIFKDAIDKMVDHSADKDTIASLRTIILDTPNVKGISRMRSRMFGAKLYLDVEIEVDGAMALKDAHEIAELVHHRVENGHLQVKHCMVHVNPV